tara:strand:+ start:2172 stop:3218 length:1047 start_codon:yes stop_codon:yes gene_type:complete
MKNIRSKSNKSLTYKKSGVDVEKGERLVDRIKSISKTTTRKGSLGDIGGFGGLFEPQLGNYTQPVLVSSTDGVGTKLRFAFELNRHDTIGIDLVAMCVNDVLTSGAEPLFFLDYIATGKLDLLQIENVITGIATGCKEADVALVGGETAEMPSFYKVSEYDVAGFCVGVVEKKRIIDGQKIQPGDIIIGISSSGPHSNGYSLIREIITSNRANLSEQLGDQTLGDLVLSPTRIYVRSIMALLASVKVAGIAHITGGGLIGNIKRVLPEGLEAQIDRTAWALPQIFEWLQSMGNISDLEMQKTFNCGIGLVVIIKKDDVTRAQWLLNDAGETVFPIGIIARGDKGVLID